MDQESERRARVWHSIRPSLNMWFDAHHASWPSPSLSLSLSLFDGDRAALPRRNKSALCSPWSLLLIKYKLLLLCALGTSEKSAAPLSQNPRVATRIAVWHALLQYPVDVRLDADEDSFPAATMIHISMNRTDRGSHGWLVGGRRLTAATTRTRRGFNPRIRWERDEMRWKSKWATSSGLY